MKFKAPCYFRDFRCLADKCSDSCCIGWEIGINDETLDKYKNLKGSLGEKIRSNICYDGTAHFGLNGEGKCPFLCSDGLCELIKHSGNELLSEICREHPRFYTVMGNVGVSGIGLACEGAAELILSTRDFGFYVHEAEAEEIDEDVDEEYNKLLSAAEDKLIRIIVGNLSCFSLVLSLNVEQITELDTNNLSFVGENPVSASKKPTFAMKKVLNALTECEPFDESFPKELSEAFSYVTESLSEFQSFMKNEFSEYSKRLLCYFIHRYLYEAFFDGSITDKLCFGVLSTVAIGAVCFNRVKSRADLDLTVRQAARVYSKNIEYNTENTDRLIEFCYENGNIAADILTLL